MTCPLPTRDDSTSSAIRFFWSSPGPSAATSTLRRTVTIFLQPADGQSAVDIHHRSCGEPESAFGQCADGSGDVSRFAPALGGYQASRDECVVFLHHAGRHVGADNAGAYF